MAFSNEVIDGGDILLYVDDKVLGCATTHSLELTTDTRDTSCKGSGDWSSMDYSRLSWSGSADFLLNHEDSGTKVRYADLLQLFKTKTKITIKSWYVDESSDEFVQYGEAIITGLNQTAPDKDNATVSLSFSGVGALGTLGRDLFYLQVTANTADKIVIEETNKVVNHSGTGVNNIPVEESTTGYTVSAFTSGMATSGSAASGAVSADTPVTVTLA